MSWRSIHTIARWTFAEFFRSWMGSTTLVGFTLLNGLTLSMLLWESSNPLLGGQGVELHNTLLPTFFSTLNLLLLMIVPALTMHSISGEQASHRLRLYQTAPLPDASIILGKAVGTACFTGTLLLSTLPLVGLLDWHAELNWIRWGLGYMSSGLLMVLWIAVGIWSSAHTKKPLISWFVSTSTILLLWFVGTIQSVPVLDAISPLPKIQEYLDGWVGLLDAFYFCSTATFLLYHAQDGLSAKRYANGRPWDQRITPVLWLVVLGMSNLLMARYDHYWDFNDARPSLSEDSLTMLSNSNNPIDISIDLEDTDFRHRQITQHLRNLETAGVDIPVTWLTNSSRPPGSERGVTLRLTEDDVEVRTVLLTSLYPSDIESGLRRLLYPETYTLCFTQNGGEASLFDGTSPIGFGQLTESLLKLDYELNVVDPLKTIEQECSLFVIAGRTTPLKREWLDAHLQATPSILLIDPTTKTVPQQWLADWGVQLKDDFVIEVNPNFQAHGNPTTLLLSQYALTEHPSLSLSNQNLLLQNVRSISRIPDNTSTLTVELLHASPQSWAETGYTADTPSPDRADIIGHVPLLVEVDSIQSGSPKPHMMVMGTSSIIQNASVEQNPHNAAFFIQMVQHLLTDERPTRSIPSDAKLQMTTAQVRTSTILSVCVLPGMIGIFGWWRRKSKVGK